MASRAWPAPRRLGSRLDAESRDHGPGSGHADRARRAVDVGGGGRGDERRRLDRGVRRLRLPRAHRGRGDGLRPRRADPAEGGTPDGPERAPRGRRGAGGVGRRRSRGRRPLAGRDPRRLGDRRHRDDRRAAADVRRARPRPRLAVLHPLRARRHGERPDRDPARARRSELRARLGVRDGLDGDRRGRRRDSPRTVGRRARRRHRGRDHAADPRGLLCDARARRGGGRSDARVSSLRCDPRGLRDGRGRLHPRARGARGRAGAWRDDLRRGPRVRRLERRAPPRPARARGHGRRRDDRRRARDGGRRARPRRLRQRARHLDAPRRPRRDARAEAGVRRPRVRAGRLVDEVRDGPLLRRRGSGRGDDVRARAPRRRPAADDQLPEPRSGVRSRLRAERGAACRDRRGTVERDGSRRPQRLRPARPRRA